MGEAWGFSPEMVGDRVYDVMGRRLGRVVALHEEEGRFEVRLAPRAARALGTLQRRIDVPLEMVVLADDHDVTLADEARFVLHPAARPPPEV